MATNAERAREAIENVCAGDLSRVAEFYAPAFHDHVNSMEFHGHDGVRRSVSLYHRLFADLRFEVDGKIVEDWGSTDGTELVRQLGAWRSFLMCVTEWRLLLDLARRRQR